MTTNPITELNALLAHDASCDAANPYRPSCIHDDRDSDARMLLCDIDSDPSFFDSDIAPQIRDLINAAHDRADAEYFRQSLTMLYLDYSLCPMHHCDYAACFDDDDDECATIREYFPDHDT